MTYSWLQSGRWRYATHPPVFHPTQQARVWPSARAFGLGMEGGPTWFLMDSARGRGQPLQPDRERDRGSRTASAELGFGRSASGRGLSDTQRLCQTT